MSSITQNNLYFFNKFAMAIRAMNNTERHNAAILKAKGFTIFWEYSNREQSGEYWALHHEIKMQYCLRNSAAEALEDWSALHSTNNAATLREDASGVTMRASTCRGMSSE